MIQLYMFSVPFPSENFMLKWLNETIFKFLNYAKKKIHSERRFKSALNPKHVKKEVKKAERTIKLFCARKVAFADHCLIIRLESTVSPSVEFLCKFNLENFIVQPPKRKNSRKLKSMRFNISTKNTFWGVASGSLPQAVMPLASSCRLFGL